MSNAIKSVKLKRQSNHLALMYHDGFSAELSPEYLRVYSPSAEVRGHGEGQEVLQWGKQNIEITHLKMVGHYALHITFADGHDTGIYSWDYLRELATTYDEKWQDYINRLDEAGMPRDADVQILKL